MDEKQKSRQHTFRLTAQTLTHVRILAAHEGRTVGDTICRMIDAAYDRLVYDRLVYDRLVQEGGESPPAR